ncbi:hypothetical protein FK268_09375 [Tsukamurella sputi]|uniref:Uncharacterized protein n=1 Tax=Tsukamurella sputi TaxID=2591848 RepID=A0A5C5RRZ3_9ACTN|nr:hypothetical protein [Tsukamurella sputi]TWS25390.1 hypothetical protein FK268_09375 [Tsukamurella sputi]
MTAALVRALPREDGGPDDQLDLPMNVVDLAGWFVGADGALMGAVVLNHKDFAEPYEMALPADRIEVIV